MGDPAVVAGATLWRLVDTVLAVGDISVDGEWTTAGRRVDVRWVEYHVESVTRCGMWIRSGRPDHRIFEDRRWVSFNTRYVSQTREEAKLCAISKRSYHVKKCKQRLAEAERRLWVLEHTATGDAP